MNQKTMIKLLQMGILINLICIGIFAFKFSHPKDEADKIESYEIEIAQLKTELGEEKEQVRTLRSKLQVFGCRSNDLNVEAFKKELDLLVKDVVSITESYDEFKACLLEKIVSKSNHSLTEEEVEACYQAAQKDSI